MWSNSNMEANIRYSAAAVRSSILPSQQTLQTAANAFHPRQVKHNLTPAVTSNRHRKRATSMVVMRGQPCIACASVAVTDKQRGHLKSLSCSSVDVQQSHWSLFIMRSQQA